MVASVPTSSTPCYFFNLYTNKYGIDCTVFTVQQKHNFASVEHRKKYWVGYFFQGVQDDSHWQSWYMIRLRLHCLWSISNNSSSLIFHSVTFTSLELTSTLWPPPPPKKRHNNNWQLSHSACPQSNRDETPCVFHEFSCVTQIFHYVFFHKR